MSSFNKSSFRKVILRIAFMIYMAEAFILRVCRLFVCKRDVFVIPSADPGALGDDGMCSVLFEHGLEYEKKVSFFYYRNLERWEHWAREHGFEQIRFVKFPAWYQCGFFLPRLLSCKRIIFIGADVVDGVYTPREMFYVLSFLNVAISMGIDVKVSGFSYSKHPDQDCVKALKQISKRADLCVRDPISLERLKSSLVSGVRLVADLAFLEPSKVIHQEVIEALDWIACKRKAGGIVLGINANYSLIPGSKNSSLESLAAVYCDFVKTMSSSQTNIYFFFLGHDDRQRNEFHFSKIILNSLSDDLKSICVGLSKPCFYREIKAICSELDLVVTGKMHLAIASLGVGTPVGCIVYQDKFEGLIEGHFGLKDVCVKPEEAFAPDALTEFTQNLLARLSEMKSQIRNRLPAVIELSKKNFSDNDAS